MEQNEELKALEIIKNELSNVNRQHAIEIMTIKNALIRKEKLEKAIQLFHDKCDFVYNPKKKMWEFTDMEYFDEEEIKIIDEVFGNATR